MLKDELNFFIANQDVLVNQYRGKVLVLKGQKVVGVYDDNIQAYVAAQRDYELGTFMIQPCEPGPQAYTVTLA